MGIIFPTIVAFLIFKPVRVLSIVLVLRHLVSIYLLYSAHGIFLLRYSLVSLSWLLDITILLLLLVFAFIFLWPFKPSNEYFNTLDCFFVLLEDFHEFTRIHLFLNHYEQLDLLFLLNALVHGIFCKPCSSWSGYGRIIYGNSNQLRNLNEVFYLVVGYRLLNLLPGGQVVSLTTIWHRMVLFIEEMKRLGIKIKNQLFHKADFF